MHAAFLTNFLTFFCDEVSFEFRTNGEFKIKVDKIEDLVFVDGAEDQDRKAHIGLPQQDPFLQMGNREIIDAGLFGGFPHGAKAMAIGVGFHGETQHPVADMVPNDRNIFFELTKIDFNPGGVGEFRVHIDAS